MRYALIKNGKVDNIIIADYASTHRIKDGMQMDDAICVDNYPVRIGDLYENGEFLTSEDVIDPNTGEILIPRGTVIERRLTDEEELKLTKADLAAIKEAIDFIILNFI